MKPFLYLGKTKQNTQTKKPSIGLSIRGILSRNLNMADASGTDCSLCSGSFVKGRYDDGLVSPGFEGRTVKILRH